MNQKAVSIYVGKTEELDKYLEEGYTVLFANTNVMNKITMTTYILNPPENKSKDEKEDIEEWKKLRRQIPNERR